MQALSRFRPRASTLAYVAVAIFVTAPAWIVRHPPMMDLPFHLATTRIIHDLHDPAYGFDADFDVRLGSTQYLAYYLLGSAVAYVVGVANSGVVLVSAYLGGTVLALRSLLAALGKDERLCLFVVPLLVNVLFMFGLFPFLIGVPLLFAALACAVRHVERPTPARGALLAATSVLLFFSHVTPFGLFAIGWAALFPWKRPRVWLRAAWPAVPSIAAVLWWALSTNAGKLTRGVVTASADDPRKTLDASLADAHSWLVDIFRDNTDEVIFIAFGMIVVLAIALGQGDRDPSHRMARAYGVVPLACIALYFTLPEYHGYISIIAQRFPILFAMTAIPLLRFPTGWRGGLVTVLVVGVGIASIVNACRHFRAFERTEVGDIEGAIASIPSKKRVCALIFDRRSTITKLEPFLHFGSYYQLEKGGVVQFTYAGYPHWPVDFKPGRYPPPGLPARRFWEWDPHQVSVENEIMPYYDYVLTRGEGFSPPPGTLHVAWQSDRWTVWARD